MTRYANFDPTQEPAPVIGWYDTEAYSYPVLPDFRTLFIVTDDQWNARLNNPTHWAIANRTTLIQYTPPPNLQSQAQTELSIRLQNGVAITSISLPTVNATYALDNNSTAQIFQIGTFCNSFGTFPSGGPTQNYPDINGVMHEFNVPVFISFLKAVAALVSNMQTQAGIMANGGVPSWPVQTATIV
jgi:hypothetical protein